MVGGLPGPQLQDLIHTALQQNYDCSHCGNANLASSGPGRITRADRLPTISGGLRLFNQRSPLKVFSCVRNELEPSRPFTGLGA